MSAGGGMGMRTVWITLRAVNYSEMAFKQAIGSVKKLSEEEKKEYLQNMRTISTARLQMQQNALQLAMLSMLATKLGAYLQLTQVGAGYMQEFNQTVKDLKSSFGDALFLALQPALDVLQQLMKWFISIDPNIKKIVVLVGLLAGGIAAVSMVVGVLNNLILMNTTMQTMNALAVKLGIAVNVKHAVSIRGLATAYNGLALSIGLSVGMFGVFLMALLSLNGQQRTIVSSIMAIAGALVILAFAMNLVTFGASGIAGAIGNVALLGSLAALGAGGASLIGQATGSFAKGTSALPATGLFLGHKGEIVYNPATNRPAGMQKEVMGEDRKVTSNNMVLNFNGDIHTKADVDDLDEVVSKRMYKAMKGAT